MPQTRTFVAPLAILALGLGASAALAQGSYPDRPVNLIVPWSAGGGTDTIVRQFAAQFEQELGQPANIVNRTGGNGVTGHTAIADATPDGYTLGACTSEIGYFDTLGLAPLTPESFTLISRLATSPAGLTVRSGAYEDAEALVAAIRDAAPGAMTASGSGIGGPWHLAIAGLLNAIDKPVTTVVFVPSQGGAPALQDLVAGGITIFSGSPVEARSLSQAGEVEILAVMAGERLEAFPEVPTLMEATDINWTYENWFSLCGPEGLPDEVLETIEAAGEKAMASDSVRGPLQERGVSPMWESPESFREFAAQFSGSASQLLKDLGLAR